MVKLAPMANLWTKLRYVTLLWLLCSSANPVMGQAVETGVSGALAKHRKSVISKVNYTLELTIPKEREAGITAKELLNFNLKENDRALQLDFKEDKAKIQRLIVNGKTVPVVHEKEHLLVHQQYLKIGGNQLDIEFQAGESALNRNADYLYTLFVPDRARTVFPCFDQPDIKATYKLTLKVAANWKAMANAPLKSTTMVKDQKTYQFETSDTLSTYLFSFIAGNFKLNSNMVGDRKADFLYRETDPLKIKHSMEEIFKLHSHALRYFEDWTAIPYPFKKFDFAAIPDFQFGGMEHVGAIQYKASTLFLDGTATKDQLNSRNNLIAHETAHMWFGDLVTMNWFSDVWMKEVFANFMADKSAEGVNGREESDLKFLTTHFPAAYAVDRTSGANPIRQSLDNLKDAGTLYGNIIYHKAPVMMQQLEQLMGKDKFQLGVREYLGKFANSNASWPDLITILDKYADADLREWNKVWVDEAGRPVINYTLEQQEGKITKFRISQSPEYGTDRLWPQFFELTLCYPDGNKAVTVNLNAREVEVKVLAGMEVPLFVLFNSSGKGYGVWPVDQAMFSRLHTIDKRLSRASAYISLYENMLNGRSIKPIELLDLFTDCAVKEKEELNLKLISGYMSTIYWTFTAKKERNEMSETLEKKIWDAMLAHPEPNLRKLLFKTYQDIFISKEAKERLYEIWKNQIAPAGVKLSEDDYTSLAFSIALREEADPSTLKEQLKRISNVDRRKRFEFIMPALSADQIERDKFFKSLEEKSNRTKEANVAAALYYLHHPLRQLGSIKYLPKSLYLLEEIQTTGDIFFPQNWLQSILGYYQDPAAAEVVHQFLKCHPGYNPKLKAKLLQAADPLFRAQKLIR